MPILPSTTASPSTRSLLHRTRNHHHHCPYYNTTTTTSPIPQTLQPIHLLPYAPSLPGNYSILQPRPTCPPSHQATPPQPVKPPSLPSPHFLQKPQANPNIHIHQLPFPASPLLSRSPPPTPTSTPFLPFLPPLHPRSIFPPTSAANLHLHPPSGLAHPRLHPLPTRHVSTIP